MRRLTPCYWIRRASLAGAYMVGLVHGLVFDRGMEWGPEDREQWERERWTRARSA